ncbi:hypothetical protein M4D70_26140, partial [Brevibacillus borstelensis]|uniref:hypothetical protein n=1 Tax=Brevibacillus borstelensis TaxID=45462 RepID=UPI00203EC405
ETAENEQFVIVRIVSEIEAVQQGYSGRRLWFKFEIQCVSERMRKETVLVKLLSGSLVSYVPVA